MFKQIRRLYLRYKAQHFQLSVPGFQIRTTSRTLVGHVDLITLSYKGIEFRGWCRAERISVMANGGSTSSAIPNLPRTDVSDVFGGTPHVGFYVVETFGNGRFTILVDRAEDDLPPLHVSPISKMRRLRALLSLQLRFLKAMILASPSIVRWAVWQDHVARQRIKQVLKLNASAAGAALDVTLLPLQEPLENNRADDAVGTFSDIVHQPITIILPVYNAFDLLPEVLERVVNHTDLPWRLIILEDCSTESALRPWLRHWVETRKQAGFDQIELIENAENLGFIRSVNLGLAKAASYGGAVVLLNSDAFVPSGWASRLLAPMFGDDTVASTTPMSNDAEIFSVPVICQRIDLQSGQADAMDIAACKMPLPTNEIEAPTGVGFCMGINPRFLLRVPQLDTVFGRGYGEEVDWCQKARKMGGRHVAVPNLFVEHRGGASFGSAEKRKLVLKNNDIVASRYPSYDLEVQNFINSDPLLTPRMVLSLAWAAQQAGTRSVPIYLAHNLGGGADMYLENKMKKDWEAGSLPSIVLRVGGDVRWQIEVVAGSERSRGTLEDFADVQRLLQPLPRRRIVYSCGVGDRAPLTIPANLMALRTSDHCEIEVLVHDYFMVSQSYTLLNKAGHFVRPIPAEDSWQQGSSEQRELLEWRQSWGALMIASDRVVVFSRSSQELILAAYPQLLDKIVVRPHQLIAQIPRLPIQSDPPRRVVAALGNIGFQKGAGVLCDLGRMLEGRDDITLMVLGEVDPAFDWPKGVYIHGGYSLTSLAKMVERFQITDWLIPSIWPETFSYTTHEALATGLPTYAFDIGAQGNAVARHDNGHLIPYGEEIDLAQSVLDRIVTKTKEPEDMQRGLEVSKS